MDKELFKTACNQIVHIQRERSGIGTLGEKTLHAILKLYFEPVTDNHEIRTGGYVADIFGDNGIIEIQTRQFNKLRSKLQAFLGVVEESAEHKSLLLREDRSNYETKRKVKNITDNMQKTAQNKVTIVYPVPRNKWLIWIDQSTGEITKKRKSPKTGTPYEIFFELYKIKQFLTHPKLSFCIVMIDLDEYRYLNGWSKDKKKGSTRYDRVPIDIVEQIYIDNIADYQKLIPATLGKTFTSKDFKMASGLSLSRSQTALNVLHYIGAVKRVGKQGNSHVYERNNTLNNASI